MKLIRENFQTPNLEIINIQIKLLEITNKLDVKTKEFSDIIRMILEFQDEDGSFKMIDTYQVESNIRQDFCHYPTYLCTVLLIKSYLYDKKSVDSIKLNKALDNCCNRNLWGHGYEGLESQLKTMKLFYECGIKEFLNYNYNQKFSNMIDEIINNYKKRIKDEDYTYGFGNYKNEIKEIVELYEK